MNTEYNPYSPPTSVINDHADSHDQVAASKGRRFGTWLIDYFIYYLIMFVIGAVLGAILGSRGVQGLGMPFWYLLAFVVVIGYYVVFESVWQRTPGKFILGTMVVNAAGTKPSVGQVFGRTLCRFIPFEPFSFFGTEGWHDSIPKTRVVMAQKR